MNIIPIKLYGLQRSGTSYVTNLLKKNFGNEIVFDLTKGWKHGPYCAYTHPEKEPNVIVVSKNPYAWMASCYNYWKEIDGLGPDLTNVSFEEFVMTSPVVLEGSTDVPFLLRAHNLMEYYNNMYYHWLSIKFKREDRKICLIRYEDALLNVNKTLDDIADIFNLKKKEYTNIENEVIWGYDEWSFKVKEDNSQYLKNKIKKFKKRNYYLNEEYTDAFNDRMLRFIERYWDNWIMAPERLSYKLKTPLFSKINMPL